MIIAIDPGITGAVAFINDSYRPISVHDIPVMAKASGKGQQLNGRELSDMIRTTYASLPDLALVEKVSAMPGQGVSSVFSFGKSAGIIEGVLDALGIPYRMVTPQKWKRAAGLTGTEKDAARAMCIRQYPHLAYMLTRKKDIGRADAILIGMYGG